MNAQLVVRAESRVINVGSGHEREEKQETGK